MSFLTLASHVLRALLRSGATSLFKCWSKARTLQGLWDPKVGTTQGEAEGGDESLAEGTVVENSNDFIGKMAASTMIEFDHVCFSKGG